MTENPCGPCHFLALISATQIHLTDYACEIGPSSMALLSEVIRRLPVIAVGGGRRVVLLSMERSPTQCLINCSSVPTRFASFRSRSLTNAANT